MQISRRRFTQLVAASAPLSMGMATARRSVVAGVPLGVQTYSFRELLGTPGDMVDKMIRAMHTLGLTECELFEPTIQPPALSANAPWASRGPGHPSRASLFGAMPIGLQTNPAQAAARDAVRRWRLATPIKTFEQVGRRFDKAGIKVLAYNFLLKDDCTDEEVERGFLATKALGAKIMTASTTITMARRTLPFAERHQVVVAMHNHSNLSDPNQFATPESFEQAIAMSPLYWINLDIGHFTAAGFDPVAFIRSHHDRITNLHIKDRKNNDGPNVPFGQGDTPIRPVLQLIKTEGYRIPCFVEYEYAGSSSAIQEVARCLDYIQAQLA